jgi:2-polyprenyl-3-methyl-5-hydroxy-6-metoxy-1,4-benzoquinol methylase
VLPWVQLCLTESGFLTANYRVPPESVMSADFLFDTVMVVNVIEHVQNAVELLHSVHKSLKPGGLLIFHERYYEYPQAADKVLGRNVFHPIRLTRRFFDHFLTDFCRDNR